MWPTADLARVQGWTAEPLRGRVSRSVAKIRHLPDTAPADLGRVWYMTANGRPAEPGPFVVQTGLTGTGRWVPGGPRRTGKRSGGGPPARTVTRDRREAMMVNSYYNIYQAERSKTPAEIRAAEAQLGGLAAELGQLGSALAAPVRAITRSLRGQRQVACSDAA